MSEIDWSRLRSVTARQIVNALQRDGFSLRNQSGSHQRYQHADGRRVTRFAPGRCAALSKPRPGGTRTTCGV